MADYSGYQQKKSIEDEFNKKGALDNAVDKVKNYFGGAGSAKAAEKPDTRSLADTVNQGISSARARRGLAQKMYDGTK